MSTLTGPELKLGERAPDFTLPSTRGPKFTLSESRGRENVLLAFFPLAFTSVCTAELCAFGADARQFEEAGTRILGISVDHTASQKAFQEKAGFTTELLSDFGREVSCRYGVLLEEQNFSKRAYFLIDQEGTLRWRHVEGELGQRRDNAELLAAIRSLA